MENTTYINYLIEISQSGRQRGFLDLCEITIPNVFTLVCRMVNNEEMARDVTARTYVLAWREIKKFNIEKSFIDWVKKISVGVAIDFLTSPKHTYKEKKLTSDKETNAAVLEKLIRGLPVQERIVFILHDLEGYTYNEISIFFPDFEVDEIKSLLINARFSLIEKLKL